MTSPAEPQHLIQSRRSLQAVVDTSSHNSELSVGKDPNGATTSYTCVHHDLRTASANKENPEAELLSNVVTVQNYYDLLFPCAMENPDVGVRYITEQLLAQTAETWKILPTGESCTDPFFHRNIWLWGIEYLDHRLMTEFGCQRLQPQEDDMCCTVVRLDLRFTASGLYYGPVLQNAMGSFVSQHMDTRETSLTIPLHTASIDLPPEFHVPTASSAESPRDRITEPSAAAQIMTTNNGSSSNSVADHWFVEFFSNASLLQLSVVGATALAVILASIAVLLARRQYHKKQRLQQRSALVQSSHPLPNVDSNETDTVADEDASSMIEPNAKTAALNTSDRAVLSGTHNDGENDPIDDLEQNSNAVPTMTEQMLDSMERNIENEAYMDDNDQGNDRSTSFSFDLGYALRSGLFLHGAAAAAPAENDEDETIDSWAQTDGTVGSLDIRLEEITAEI